MCHGKPCHEPHLGSPKPWLCPALISSDSLLLPAEGLSVLEGSVSHDVLNILSQMLSLAPGRLPLASCPLRACSMLSDSCFGNEQHEIDACQTQPCWCGQSGQSVVTRNFSAGWGFTPLLHHGLGGDGVRWWTGQFWKHGYIPASLHGVLVSILTWMVTVLLYLQVLHQSLREPALCEVG